MPFRCAFMVAAATVLSAGAQAAFVIEIDTDGADDGVLTFNANFAFGGDTTTASQSAATGAVGTTGGDSIFGGDGANDPDTYLYTYTPGTDADNFFPNPGDLLGTGVVAGGLVGGGDGLYGIYATWPFTQNVSGGLTNFELVDTGTNTTVFSTSIDQNDKGDDWVRLGYANLTAGTTYELSQSSTSNSFVSQRAAAVMFELPEPASLGLVALGGVAVLRRRSA